MATSRQTRRNITGAAPGWKVNRAGIIFRHQRRAEITQSLAGWPTVDLGGGYLGPVPPAGAWDNTERLVDEIVCYEFHGSPPRGWWRGCHVRHIDGDSNNCAADNLEWLIDEEYAKLVQANKTKRLLRPEFLPRRPVRTSPHKLIKAEPLFVGACNLAGWRPIASINPSKERSYAIA